MRPEAVTPPPPNFAYSYQKCIANVAVHWSASAFRQVLGRFLAGSWQVLCRFLAGSWQVLGGGSAVLGMVFRAWALAMQNGCQKSLKMRPGGTKSRAQIDENEVLGAFGWPLGDQAAPGVLLEATSY